ncbi:PQQ-dependent sugar dehydrogenase [Marivita hallyeonensis]|uniref:Glucose/arabinose dehydrogenase, beta-propeller fold n=1 Tax=Marivita hallyeonensis TaxID=996342 RepID=A0A1M5QVG3_9RHOB|nr:PQQ-dependent sugar dehydrogenase [Marivita hallyeonensis]SHH17699.1 Glucose/arabinose dehydrogenase, beta-propeller fold [Marivita hallyeonensis]
MLSLRSLSFTVLLAVTPALCAAQVTSETLQTQAGAMQASAIVTGLDTPWAFGFLPNGKIVLTERRGDVLLITPGEGSVQLRNPPNAYADGQGGLLDVLVPRDFAQSRELFFTHAIRQGRGSGTAVTKARLSADETALTNVEVIFQIAPGSSGGRHFGSRIAEAPDGTLFLTVGDRGDRPSAQDRSVHNGSVLRINKDGSVPTDNPFVNTEGVQPEIWSYGHRNPQGAAFDENGQFWVNEHGARGGDEVNRVEKGANYGWPVIAYGRHYSGRSIGEGTSKPGMEQPVTYWDPSIAPSGMAFYNDGPVRSWDGDMFVGSLKFDYIARLDGSPLREVEQIQGDSTQRVRDIRQGPNGDLWFLSVGNGALYRMSAPSS